MGFVITHTQNNVKRGNRYQVGQGVQIDMKKAFKYFTISAEQGNRTAMFNLAYFYNEGIECESDYEKCRELLREAARPGDEDAIRNCRKNNIDY